MSVPRWTGHPVWLHGDLHPANMVVADGTLRAVIDFGDLTSGDPATDLATAWLTFNAAGRRAFVGRVQKRRPADTATWQRAGRRDSQSVGQVWFAATRPHDEGPPSSVSAGERPYSGGGRGI